MAKSLPSALSVFGPDELMGTLYPSEPLSFRYSRGWLEKRDAQPLHPALPLSAELFDSPFVTAFFENLLPEGDQRTLISMREQVSTVFGLLSRVGGESAGSVVLLPEGEEPESAVYQPLTWAQVDTLVRRDANPAEREAIEEAAKDLPTPRMSISGAQHKLLLYIDADGTPQRPMGSSPSTHILKPDIVRSDINIFASAVNETIMMLAASKCGLPTAAVAYQPVTRACLVERYDRRRMEDGTVRRIWQADFCQLLGKASDAKYEHDGGPGFAECFALLQRSAQPGVDQRQLLRWLFFNLYTGNNDSHAKNLSMIAAGRCMRLAPFYDLMCTRAYAGLGAHFAFSIAGESDPGKLTREHVVELAGQLGIGAKYLVKVADSMADAVDAAVPAAATEVMTRLGASERVLAQRIVDKVASITRRMRQRIVT
ncbi:type II toxin-antitoxin system HipA family toxin [uncultured Massilia sp.]|uniref:type II toxin-antitoxin system HipA family toxin n=1 Tax=uncultured Massilia sp. TaxID=169973 RepID=UPI00258C8E28|nr:type II toxin-antitoxin system HipA family toxin [uncultured Massilia sp.]